MSNLLIQAIKDRDLVIANNILRGPQGLDANDVDRHKRNALMIACFEQLDEQVALMLERPDIRLSSQDEDGWTALTWAVAGGSEVVLNRMLALDEQQHLNLPSNDGRTPLMCACIWGRVSMVRSFATRDGVDLNWQDDEGQTALIMSTLRQDEDSVRVLLENGADPMVKEKGGWCAYDFALAAGYHNNLAACLKNAMTVKP